MNIGQVKRAEAYAVVHLQEWLEQTGVMELHTSYHSELEGIVEDAVHIGIQMALFGKVEFDKDGNVKHKQ